MASTLAVPSRAQGLCGLCGRASPSPQARRDSRAPPANSASVCIRRRPARCLLLAVAERRATGRRVYRDICQGSGRAQVQAQVQLRVRDAQAIGAEAAGRGGD